MNQLKINLIVYDENGIAVNIDKPVFDSGIYTYGNVKDNEAYNFGDPLGIWDSIVDSTMIFSSFKSEFIPIVFYESSLHTKYYLLVRARGILARVLAYVSGDPKQVITGNSKTTYIRP